VLLILTVLVGALVVVAVGARVGRFAQLPEEKERAWPEAARSLGLTFTPSSDPYRTSERSIHGVYRGVPIRVESKQLKATSVEANYTSLHFSAGGDGRIPAGLEVCADSMGRSLGRLVQGRDEEIGDEGFDARVELPNMDARACAALSADAREQLRPLIELGGSVQQGQIRYEVAYSEAQDRRWLIVQLGALAELAELLSVSRESVHDRLSENALRDPSAGVRLRNLCFLVEPTTRTPRALLESTARALLTDPDSAVRLLAAAQLGPEGGPVFLALLSDPDREAESRIEALRALDASGALGPELLERVLRTEPTELVCETLSIIARRCLSGLSAQVVACTHSSDEKVREAAATALGRVAAPGVEQALLRLLSDPSAEVQRASAESLAAVGSVRAVEPLLPLAEGVGRAQLRRAARAAIGRIQGRLGNVEAGRVSLTEGHELSGAVDVLGPEAAQGGELSLPGDRAVSRPR
jgi:hypothetical protein